MEIDFTCVNIYSYILDIDRKSSNMSAIINFPINIVLENDLEIDEDGKFFLVNYLVPENEDDDEGIENYVEFETIIEEVIDESEDNFRENPSDAYRKLYNIAHEFSRYSERVREVAQKMEESNHTSVTEH